MISGALRDGNGWLGDAELLRARAASDGYLFLPGLVDTPVLTALRDRLLRLCSELGWLSRPQRPDSALAHTAMPGLAYDHPDYLKLQAEGLILPEFQALREHAGIVAVMELLLGGPVRALGADIVRVAFPDSARLTTQAHQDHYYLRAHPQLWAVWIALLDCPLQLGPLALIPGSNQNGLLAHDKVADAPEKYGRFEARVGPDAYWFSADLKAGDAIFFHCLTVHRAAPNLSADRLRLSVDLRFIPVS